MDVDFFCGYLIFLKNLSQLGIEYRDDEIFYFRNTQEMLFSGNFLSPSYFSENRFQKTILFYWLVLLSYKIFGVNWFAARFVSVVFAALTIVLTWAFARKFFNR